jgi:Bacterial type II/III secretion system short domain
MSDDQRAQRGSMAIWHATYCLALLTTVSFAGRCFAQNDPQNELERQRAKIAELQQQLKEQQINLQTAQEEMQQRQQVLRQRRAAIELQFGEAQRKYQEMEAQAAAAAVNDRQVKVFALQHLAAREAADAISNVLGRDSLRVGLDERANRLIVSSTAKQLDTIQNLLRNLDVASADAAAQAAAHPESEMLQVRVIWVANGKSSADEADRPPVKLDERVLGALRPLGFPAPSVVCQTVTSLVVNERQDNSFSFAAPVALGGAIVRFEGAGKIQPTEENRYLVRVALSLNPTGRGPEGNRACHVEGAISTPLDHYTILGTSVVVSKAGTASTNPEQVPCAFVVQLNRTGDQAGSGVSSSPAGHRSPSETTVQ